MILLLLFPLIGWSNTPETRKLIEEALLQAPKLHSYSENYNSQKKLLQQSRLINNPILTYQTGRLKSDSLTGAVHDISLNQPFPWPGRRSSRIKSHEFLLKISELDLEETKLALTHQIFLLCAEFSALEQIEKHHAERRNRFALIHQYLASRPQVSPRLIIEREMIEAQIKLVDRSMLELSMKKLHTYNELTILTGQDKPVVTFNWEKLPVVADKSTYFAMIDNNLALKKQIFKKNISENRVQEAALESRPDIMLGVNYREENVEPVNRFYHAQISVAIPIIDYGQHAKEAARAQLRKTEAEGKVEFNSVRLEIEHSFEAMQVAKKTSEIFPYDSLKKEENKFKQTELAFRRGQIDAMTFVQSDIQNHEVLDQIFGSRLDYYTQLSRLNALVGKTPEL